MRARVALVNAAAAVACWLLDRADRRLCRLSREMGGEEE